jgi:hypothetical protein
MPWYDWLWFFVTDKATVLSTVVTALCTIAIAMFTARLVRVSEAQGALTERALVESRRAFVGSPGFTSLWEKDGSGQYCWRFQARWQNDGETPTKNLRYGVRCEVRNTPLPVGYDFEANAPENGRGLLGAKVANTGGMAPTMGREAPVSPQDLVDTLAGRKFIYFYGWAKYNDIYDGTPEHGAGFCYIIFPIGADPTKFDPAVNPQSVNFPDLQHSEGNWSR